MSNRTERRSWKRVCSISRYFCRNSSSSCSETRGRAGSIEREAQEIAQAADHAIGAVRIRVHERRDGVQRVEEEMWLQLGFERAQPRLDQAGFELRFLDRARLRLLAVMQRVAQSQHRRVGHQREIEILEVAALQVQRPGHGRRLAARFPQQEPHADHAGAVNDGVADGGEGVDAQRANPVRTIEPEAMSEPEDDWRQRRGDVPVDKVEEEQLAHLDVHRVAQVECGETIGLERREEAENRGGSEHPPQRRCPGALHC